MQPGLRPWHPEPTHPNRAHSGCFATICPGNVRHAGPWPSTCHRAEPPGLGLAGSTMEKCLPKQMRHFARETHTGAALAPRGGPVLSSNHRYRQAVWLGCSHLPCHQPTRAIWGPEPGPRTVISCGLWASIRFPSVKWVQAVWVGRGLRRSITDAKCPLWLTRVGA